MLGVCWARCWSRPRRPGYVTIRYSAVGRYTTESCGGTYVGQESIPMYFVRYVDEESVRTYQREVGVCTYNTIRYHALDPESVVMYVTIRGDSEQAEGSGQAVACGQWTLADQSTFTLPMLLHPSRRSSQCGTFLV